MARLYANENLRSGLVIELRNLGHDVLTSNEAGQANQEIPDEEVLAFAVKEKRAIITYNRKDFRRLHKQGNNHSGIILCKEDRDDFQYAKIVNDLLIGFTSLENKMISVRKPNI